MSLLLGLLQKFDKMKFLCYLVVVNLIPDRVGG